MRSKRNLYALLFLGLIAGGLSACATNGEDAAMAGGESQATLETILQADVTSTRFPARLVRIDGENVSTSRRTHSLEPGTHTLSFELDLAAVSRYEPETGRYKPKPSSLTTDLREKQVTFDFAAGTHYKFGAEIEDFKYAAWKPFVVKADELK